MKTALFLFLFTVTAMATPPWATEGMEIKPQEPQRLQEEQKVNSVEDIMAALNENIQQGFQTAEQKVDEYDQIMQSIVKAGTDPKKLDHILRTRIEPYLHQLLRDFQSNPSAPNSYKVLAVASIAPQGISESYIVDLIDMFKKSPSSAASGLNSLPSYYKNRMMALIRQSPTYNELDANSKAKLENIWRGLPPRGS